MASQAAKNELNRLIKGYDPSIAFEDAYRRDMFIVIIQYLLEAGVDKLALANMLYESTGYDLRSYINKPTDGNLGKAYDYLETRRAEFPFPNAAYVAVTQLVMAVSMLGNFR